MLSEVRISNTEVVTTTTKTRQRMQSIFKALSNPTRIKIINILSQGECSVNDLSEQIGASQSQTSHQLNQLRGADLVAFEKRGTQSFYRLADDDVARMVELARTLAN